MKLIEDMIQHFKDIDLNMVILEAVRDNEHVVIDMNAEKQLFEEGITSHGISIASYAPYSQVTIDIKRAKGQPVNRVTLRDEGDFQHSFFVYYGSDYFQISASDWKTEELKMLYGDDILGLTEENRQQLTIDIIVPYVLNKLRYVRKG